MVIAHDVAEPLYLQIRDSILAEIKTGRYVPHQRLPSERELSVAYGVSRMTVRQALVDLQRGGNVYARVGKGTFASAPKIDQQLRLVTSFTQDMRGRGQRPTSRILTAQFQPAAPDVADPLELTPGTRIAVLSRVRLADERPLAIETAYLPAETVPGLFEHDFARESLYEVLARDYGLTLIAASQTIEAALADPRELELLEMEAPAAVLRMRRLTRAGDRRAIELVRSTYRGDLYQLHSTLEPIAPRG